MVNKVLFGLSAMGSIAQEESLAESLIGDEPSEVLRPQKRREIASSVDL